MKVAEIVTDIIIKKLEKGVIPWFKPWQGGESINYVTRKPYKGINRLLLDGGEYLTFNQIQERGGKIKKGAKAEKVVFYKELTYKETTEEGEETITNPKLLRYYNVFSLTDVEGIESKTKLCENKNYEIERCEKLIKEYTKRTGIVFSQQESTRAYYSAAEDKIVVPKLEQFKSSESYYATAFHEITHSTGHSSRLNRLESTEFGSTKYGKEELTAEIGSAGICNIMGIDQSVIDNSAAYISSWIKAIKGNPNMILAAAAKAQQAIDYIME